MDEKRKGFSGYGDTVKIHHVHIKDSVAPKKSFITLDIAIDKELHWNITSIDRCSILSIYLHLETAEAQVQEILALAFASAHGCKEQ